MTVFRRTAALAVGGFLAAQSLPAQEFLNTLNPDQQADVKKGSQVVLTEKVEGKPWPRVRIYRTIDATPEQVAAVFFDFGNAKAFVPNVLKSEISNRVSTCVVDVDYGLNVPILPDEFYTTRNTVRQAEAGQYCFDWKLLRAVQTKDSVGSFRVAPMGAKAVVCYENLVTPGSSMAGLLRGKAIEQMTDTVTALAAYVEKQKSAPETQEKINALRAALAGK